MNQSDPVYPQNSPKIRWITPKMFLEEYKGLIGRTFLYEQIRAGAIPSKKLGRKKILIPAEVLDYLPDASRKLA